METSERGIEILKQTVEAEQLVETIKKSGVKTRGYSPNFIPSPTPLMPSDRVLFKDKETLARDENRNKKSIAKRKAQKRARKSNR